MKRFVAFLLFLVVLLPTFALAEETVWELVDEQGQHLTSICYEPDVGDTYLSGDNHLYQIIRVEGSRAIAQDQGLQPMPDVSWLEDMDAAQPVSALTGERRLAFYCTHSDESYEPSDGTYSSNEHGSVYQVAHALADSLAADGVTCDVSDELHHPHDAGAYRRSRQTAVALLKSAPDAIFDIHRDGIPNPDEYAVTLGGKSASKIRLLVGRGNQNMEVNKEFALLIKAVADKVYPGLIKDIYMGKGAFNQDLYPQALLLECGTYTLEKERVMTSLPMLADVIYRSLWGGVTGSAGSSATTERRSAQRSENDGITMGATDAPTAPEHTASSSKGILWVVGVLVVGLIVYGVLATGSFKGGMRKAGRNLNEMTGGLVGKKPDDSDEPGK